MTTELDIINQMLAVTGQERINTIDSLHPTAVQAYDSLRSTDLDFQSPGWWFNRELNLKLDVQTNGEVNAPADVLSFVAHPERPRSGVHYNYPIHYSRYTLRGVRVYDSLNHTYNIGHPIYADVIVRLPVEQLPEIAASYLKHLCKHMFYKDDDGDIVKLREIEKDKAEAWHRLYSQELKENGANALNSPSALQLRYRIGQYGTTTNPMYPGGLIRT